MKAINFGSMKAFHFQLYATGLVLFLFPALYLCLATLFFTLGFSISGWSLFLTLLGAFALVYFTYRPQLTLLWGALSIGFIVLSFGICNTYFDVSFDGQWYHQDAVRLLKEGWNPIWDSAISTTKVSGLNANYVNCYPKATWVFQGGVFSLTDNIELGKGLHLLSLLSLACLLFPFLHFRLKLRAFYSLLVTLMCCASTITLGQIFSFYVDGILFSYLGIFLVLGLEYLEFDQGVFPWVLLSFVFLVNIKFTGLVYSLIFCVFGILFYGMKLRRIPWPLIGRVAVIVMTGVVVVGYPTYVRNSVEQGHPFFPILGKNNEGKAIAEVQYPQDFFQMNRFQKAWKAHASLPIYTDHDHPSVAKPLFTSSVINSSVPYYRNHQPLTMSPFGPIEAELWILFIPLLVLLALRRPSWKIWLLLAALILSMLVQPEFWNLRYAPQLLFVVVLVCLSLLRDPSRWVQGSALVFILLFLGNGLITSYQNWQWVREKSIPLEQALLSLRGKQVALQRGWMNSFELKLAHYNITPIYRSIPNASYQAFPGDAFSGWKTIPKTP